MSVPVFVGSPVPLQYLANDRNASLYVRARIYSISDTLLATKDLAHVEDGRYSNFTYFMPNVDLVKVRYDPYKDVGYTQFSSSDGSIDQEFTKLELNQELVRNDEIVAIFEESDESLNGLFSDEQICVTIEPNITAIEAVIADEAITFTVTETDGLCAVISC